MISILLSAYNGGKFIIEQLNSIRYQTLQPDEVIIIDDNSKDNTIKLCEQFILDNNLAEKWKIIKNDVNRGWQYNFHYGVKYTHGDYIFYCDQDDIWVNSKIEKLMFLMNKYRNLNVIATNEKKIFNDGSFEYLYKPEDKLEIIDVEKYPKDVFIRCSGCSMVVKRTFLDKIENYYVDGYAHDAMAWNFASIDKTCALYHDYTVIHRIHGNNVTVKKNISYKNRVKSARISCSISQTILDYLKDNYNENFKLKQIYTKYNKADTIRYNFLQKHKIRYIVPLIRYSKYLYRRPRQLFGDIYYSLFKFKKEGE